MPNDPSKNPINIAINSDPYFSSAEYAALSPNQQQAAIQTFMNTHMGPQTNQSGDTTNYNPTGENDLTAFNQGMNLRLKAMGRAPTDSSDTAAVAAWLRKDPESNYTGLSDTEVLKQAAGTGIIPPDMKIGGEGLKQAHTQLGNTLANSMLAVAAGGAGAAAAPALGITGGLGNAALSSGINAGVGAAEGETPEQIALGAATGLGGAGLGAAIGDVTPLEQAALNAGVKSGVGAAEGQSAEQIALGDAAGLGEAALNSELGTTGLEKTAINTGVNAGLSQIPQGTNSPTQKIGNTLATNPTAGTPAPTPDPNNPGFDTDGNLLPPTVGTGMPGAGPSTLGTLSSIASQLAPLGAATGAAASAAGNTQRANIDTNSAAQSAYNAGLISRAQLEDTQRANEAKDVARQGFLENFTGGANVTAGGQTGLTPISPLEKQTLDNLATQGATALSKAPTYSAANMKPLTDYTGAANISGTSPLNTLGTALTAAGPLMKIGTSLAGLIPKGGGGGGGNNPSLNTGGGSANGPAGSPWGTDANGNPYPDPSLALYNPALDPNVDQNAFLDLTGGGDGSGDGS